MAALPVTNIASETAKSVVETAMIAAAVELPPRCDGRSICSVALSGSSAGAGVLTVISGASNTRSITRSPVVHRQIRSASQPMTNI